MQGDLRSGHPEGLFIRDTRVLSRLTLHVDGRAPEHLKTVNHDLHRADYILRTPDPHSSGTALLIERRRHLCNGLHEEIVIRNLTQVATVRRIHIGVSADFADLFAVKENRHVPSDEITMDADGSRWSASWPRFERGVTIEVQSQESFSMGHDSIDALVVIPAGKSIEFTLLVHATFAGSQLAHVFHESRTTEHHHQRRNQPQQTLSDDIRFLRTLEQSRREIDSLQMADDEFPEDIVVAAGAPWFMALFGRDSIIASLFLLTQRPELGAATARTLARLQGKIVNPLTEEEPGKILHETRFGIGAELALGGRSIYYGSVDSTPLFVWLVSELWKWGAIGPDELQALLPHLDASLTWCDIYGDKDRDGFIEYQRATDQGLINQGWKDSWDGITFASGELALAPIALAEVQGYYYAALNGRADLADALGEDSLPYRLRAERLRQEFDQFFWLPNQGYYALGLDRQKKQIDSLTSNLGHLLWTGIVLPERAEQVAKHLTAPDLRSRWGIRTLAASMTAYNPLSYHNGSIWPHDTTIAISGLIRYEFHDEAMLLTRGLLDAASALQSRLPELLAGFAAEEFAEPIPYPTSCSPQAWAAASTSQLLRCIAGIDVRLGNVVVDPHFPEGMNFLSTEFRAFGESVHFDLRRSA